MRTQFDISSDIIIEKDDEIILVKRKKDPYAEKFALPGGHMESGETIEKTAIREAKEETSLDIELLDIVGVYSGPDRYPDCKTLTVVFAAKPIGGELKAADDAKEAAWVNINEIIFDDLAFDHAKIIEDYIKWKELKGTFWAGR